MIGPIEPSNTIIACSSGNDTNTAISIIRLSGSFTINNFSDLFEIDSKKIKPRQIYRSNLVFNNEVIDDIMFSYFENPNSYTGENLLELYCHGNRLNVERIINLFVDNFNFISHSKPGEFTLRALKNKKLTLSQVEGLDLLLNAQHSYAFSHGLSLLNGDLSDQYKELYNKFLDLRVKLELLMDFSDDIGEKEGADLFKESFGNFSDFVHNLTTRARNNSEELISPKVVLFGPVNSGKSTFYNQLLGIDRSIVSNEEGTTRDYISETFNAGDLICQLIDTAGIRDADNSVEIEGIKRSLSLARGAFYKILITDVNKYKKYFSKLKEIKPDLVVITHLDTLISSMSLETLDDCDYLFLNLNKSNSKYEILSLIKCEKQNASKSNVTNSHGLFEDSGPIEPETKIFKNGPMGPKVEEIEIGPMGPRAKEIKSGPIGPKILVGNTGPIGPVPGLIERPDMENNKSESNLNKLCLTSLSKLLKLLVNIKFETLFRDEPILLSRHKSQIINIHNKTTVIDDQLELDFDLGIITNLLENLEVSLEELIGIVNSDDVLDRVFSGFCIGK